MCKMQNVSLQQQQKNSRGIFIRSSLFCFTIDIQNKIYSLAFMQIQNPSIKNEDSFLIFFF